MKPKIIIKISVDILMTLGLLFVMGYQFWGEYAHEWVGAVMFVLFIAHHILNGSWYKNLFRGKYTPIRIFTLVIDVLVFLDMLALMYSGITMSRYVFDFLLFNGNMILARRLHLLGSYWGIILMSLHIGLHWNMIISMIKKVAGLKKSSEVRTVIFFIMGLLIAVYGVYVLIHRDFGTYLFLKTEFVFLDYGENKWRFYADYLALMGTFIFAAHYLSKLFRIICLPKSKNNNERGKT